MLSITECRKLLGTFASDKPDEEIEELKNELYAIAKIAIDQFTIQNKK